jgi:hypothetical protein
MDQDFSVFEHYLRSGDAGHYKTNYALICLSPEHSYWFPHNGKTLERWCIFAHEYAHFLHNFSTVSGLLDFVAHLRLTGLFVRTVGVDGHSRGMAALDAHEQRDFTQWLIWGSHLRGSASPPFDTGYHANDVQIRITGIKRSFQRLELSTQSTQPEMEHAEVSFAVSTPRTAEQSCSVKFGSSLITEAAAYEIERIICKANGEDVALIDARMPTYPYRMGRILFEHLVEEVPPEEVLSRVCLMALQSTDPGASFIDIATAFATRPAGESHQVTLQRFEHITVREMQKNFADLANRTLQPEFDRFAIRRGPVGHAIATLGDLSRQYIELRLGKHFFELDLFEQPHNSTTQLELLSSYPPCPIVHEAGGGNHTAFTDVAVPPLPPDAVVALSAYQALGKFMWAHITSNGFLPTADVSRPSPCLFSGICAAPQALQTPGLCTSEPWSAFHPSEPPGCFYAEAVSAARGRADL